MVHGHQTKFVTIDAGTGVAIGSSNKITYTVSASPCTDATATIVLTVSNDYLTTGVNSNWSNTACWGGGVVPPSSGDVTISHDVTVDASTNTLGAVTVDASKTLTVATWPNHWWCFRYKRNVSSIGTGISMPTVHSMNWRKCKQWNSWSITKLGGTVTV